MNLIPKMIKMTVIRKRLPPNHSEMIIISVILEWCEWPSFEKALEIYFWFMTDLSAHFQMMPEPRFRYDGMTSFRYDRENIRLWLSHFLISEVGGFTSYHNEKENSFLLSLKTKKVVHLKTKIILKSFRNSIIPKGQVIFYDFW